MGVIATAQCSEGIHAQTQTQPYQVVGKHTRVRKISLALFELLVRLGLGQAIERQAEENEPEPLEELELVLEEGTALAGDFVQIEDHEAHRDEESDEVLLVGGLVYSSKTAHQDHGNHLRALAQHHEGEAHHFHGVVAAVHGAEIQNGHDYVAGGEGLRQGALAGDDYNYG
uniref:Uncharacterized protein n=1 Tax=Strombidium inclinatum TaxID=197538 RepID=A0A7S3IFU4_9SPIT